MATLSHRSTPQVPLPNLHKELCRTSSSMPAVAKTSASERSTSKFISTNHLPAAKAGFLLFPHSPTNPQIMTLNDSLTKLVFDKSDLKQQVYQTTKESFELFRSTTRELTALMQQRAKNDNRSVRLEFADHGDFEFEIKFGGDILLFLMHTNVFEFPRDHQVMKSAYIKEDPSRSYCGVIHIYNFLNDSFLYQREQDLGYLIGRMFINRENHYFIEGKRELGMIYTNFNNSLISTESIQKVLESAMEYTTNFDLLTPPYDTIKVVSVGEMMNNLNKKSFTTGKRLGFRFQADND